MNTFRAFNTNILSSIVRFIEENCISVVGSVCISKITWENEQIFMFLD